MYLLENKIEDFYVLEKVDTLSSVHERYFFLSQIQIHNCMDMNILLWSKLLCIALWTLFLYNVHTCIRPKWPLRSKILRINREIYYKCCLSIFSEQHSY